MPPVVHRALRRVERIVCWTIGLETVGGLAWYAVLAGSYITVVLLLALAVIGWKANHDHRRRR